MTPPLSLRATPEAVVLALAVPALALHRDYSPGLSLHAAGTILSIELGDIAMLAVAIASVTAVRRLGAGPLRGAWTVLVPAGVLWTLVLLAALAGRILTDGYPTADKLVSAAKFVEYGLLVLAVPLIVRRTDDAVVIVGSVLATGVAATTSAVLQLFGLLPNLDNTPAGRRMPSFAGYHDFATLSGLTLALALGAIVLGHPRSLRPAVWIAAVSGTAGAIIGGALSTVIALLLGIVFAASAMLVRRTATRTRAAALVAVAAALLAGSAAMRSGDIADFVGFLGSEPETSATGVQTYSQRTVLSYIGIRIFLDHPLVGVGWQASELPVNFERYVADVRRRFPEVSDEAIPSAEHPWGVQNAYVQAAADMGIAGLLVTVWLALAAVARAGRATFSPSTRSSQLALSVTVAMLVCAFEWAALGLVAGAPATAFLWLALGASIAVAVPGERHRPTDRAGAALPVSMIP